MLQIISQFITNEQELNKYEKANHADAFEYMPMSKGKPYTEMVDVDEEPVTFLAIRVTAFEGEPAESELLNNGNINNANLRVLSALNRVLSKFSDEFEVLSMSYQTLKLKTDGVVVNALLLPESGEELLEKTIKTISANLKQSLKIKLNDEDKELLGINDNNDSIVNENVNENSDTYTNNATDVVDATDTVDDYKFYNDTYNNKEESNRPNIDLEKEDIDETNKEDTKEYTHNRYRQDIISEANNTNNVDNTNNITNKNNAKELSTDNNKKLTSESTLNNNPFKSNQLNPLFKFFAQAHNVTTEHQIKPINANLDKNNNNLSKIDSVTDNSKNSNNRINAENLTNNQDINKNKETEKFITERAATEKIPQDNKNEPVKKNYEKKNNTASKTVSLKSNNGVHSTVNNSTKSADDKKIEHSKNNNSDNKTDRNVPNTNAGEKTEKFIAEIYTPNPDDKKLLENQQNCYKNETDIPFLNKIETYIPINNILDLEADDPKFEIHEEDYNVKTTASEKKINSSFERVINYFMENESLSLRRTLTGEKEEKSFMEDVKIHIDKYLHLPEEDKDFFLKKCYRAFFSYYVLTPAINDPNISDIRVLAPNNINVKIHGNHYTADGIAFLNEADYNRFIEALIIRNKVTVNSPILVFTDKDFNDDYILRFNLCLPTINSTGMPYLHIRKVPKKKTTVKDLINAGMMDNKIAAYILDKVISAKGIVFAGPSASGKTTAMNAFIDFIPKDKSILCIQESEELFSHIHPNAYFQHMLKDARGNTVVGLSELGQNGLLCDAGYFIIGECKGAEVRDLLRASNTGHKCWCSVHSQSTTETIPRLADYVKYGSDYSLTEATRMLKDLEIIIYIEGFKIQEITEIVGYNEEDKKIIYKTVYKRNVEQNN